MHRIKIRNTESGQNPCPHVLDVLLDGDTVYFEFKCKKCTQKISFMEVLRQIRESTNTETVAIDKVTCWGCHCWETA